MLKNNLIETTWEKTGCVVVLNVVGPSMVSCLKFEVVMADAMHFCRRVVVLGTMCSFGRYEGDPKSKVS